MAPPILKRVTHFLTYLIPKPERKKTRWTIAVLLSLFLTTLLVTPAITKHLIVKQLTLRGAEQVSMDNVDFNLFTGYLRVDNLTVVNQGKTRLQIGKLETIFSWYEAIFQNTMVSNLNASNIVVEVDTDKRLSIAGLTNFKARKDRKPLNKRIWVINNVNIADLTIQLKQNNKVRPIYVRKLTLGKINSLKSDSKGKMSVTGNVFDGHYAVQLESRLFNDSPELHIAMIANQINLLKLSKFVKLPVSFKKGTADYKSKVTLRLDQNSKVHLKHAGVTTLKNTRFRTKQFTLASPALQINDTSQMSIEKQRVTNPTTRFSVNSKRTVVSLPNTKSKIRVSEYNVSGDLNYKSRRLANTKAFAGKVYIEDDSNNFELLELSKINLPSIDISPKHGVRLKNIETDAVEFASTITPDKSIINQFNQRVVNAGGIKIDTLDFSPVNGLGINSMQITGFRAYLYRDAEKWPLLAMTKKVIKELRVKFPKLHINHVSFRRGSEIHIIDKSFPKLLRTRIQLQEARFSQIDSRNRAVRMQYLIRGKLDKYAKFKLKGSMRPFTRYLNLRLDGDIDEVRLTHYSPYVAAYYGYEITNGHMDAKIDLTIKNGVLSGANDLVFKRLSLKQAPSKSKNLLTKIRLPADVMVKLLANSKNELKIKIPNKGDMKDPKFKLGVSYGKAFESTFKRGIEIAFRYGQPIGQAMTILGKANKLITAIRLRNIEFAAGSRRFRFKSRRHLKKAAKLLQRKKKLTLRLCGQYTKADVLALSGSQTGIPPEGELKERLEKLTLERADRIKSYLVKRQKIDSKRLFVCKPKWSDEGEPVVRLLL